MKKSVKKKWVKALETQTLPNGKKARQVKEQLAGTTKKGKDGFCCLGVLCEIAIDEGVISDYHPTDGELPDGVVEWAELNNPNPRVKVSEELGKKANNNPDVYTKSDKYEFALSVLNDELNQDFPSIAKYIKESL